MQLHILSDLHIEFGDFTPPDTDADVLFSLAISMSALRALSGPSGCFQTFQWYTCVETMSDINMDTHI